LEIVKPDVPLSPEVLRAAGQTDASVRCFAALTDAPATESQLVARTKYSPRAVSDALERLHGAGLVTTVPTPEPTYLPVSPAEAVRSLREEHEARLASAAGALYDIGSPSGFGGGGGIWSVATDRVTDRMQMLIRDARREVVLALSDASALSSGCLETIAIARSRGATVRAIASSDEVRERISRVVPDARLSSPPRRSSSADDDADESPLGQWVMADRRAVLVLAPDPDGALDVDPTPAWSTDERVVDAVLGLLEREIDRDGQSSDRDEESSKPARKGSDDAVPTV
jgi:hypothetical protein